MLKVLFLRCNSFCTPFMRIVEVNLIFAQYENIRTTGTGNSAKFFQCGINALIKFIDASKKSSYLLIGFFNSNGAANGVVRVFSGLSFMLFRRDNKTDCFSFRKSGCFSREGNLNRFCFGTQVYGSGGSILNNCCCNRVVFRNNQCREWGGYNIFNRFSNKGSKAEVSIPDEPFLIKYRYTFGYPVETVPECQFDILFPIDWYGASPLTEC